MIWEKTDSPNIAFNHHCLNGTYFSFVTFKYYHHFFWHNSTTTSSYLSATKLERYGRVTISVIGYGRIDGGSGGGTFGGDDHEIGGGNGGGTLICYGNGSTDGKFLTVSTIN